MIRENYEEFLLIDTKSSAKKVAGIYRVILDNIFIDLRPQQNENGVKRCWVRFTFVQSATKDIKQIWVNFEPSEEHDHFDIEEWTKYLYRNIFAIDTADLDSGINSPILTIEKLNQLVNDSIVYMRKHTRDYKCCSSYTHMGFKKGE